MEKQYISPTCEVVNIQSTANLLQASLTISGYTGSGFADAPGFNPVPDILQNEMHLPGFVFQ